MVLVPFQALRLCLCSGRNGYYLHNGESHMSGSLAEKPELYSPNSYSKDKPGLPVPATLHRMRSKARI